MDTTRFDSWTRALVTSPSRRQVLRTLALGAGVTAFAADPALAGPGCKDVGKKCKKAAQCCSGICRGKKGKKRCKAHDASTCLPGQQEVICGGLDSDTADCTTGAGAPGHCNTTTGNAGYCTLSSGCFACSKDADCRDACGSQAACIQCTAECDFTGGAACAGTELCVFPA